MRQIAAFLLPLLALLPQTAAAQELVYDFAFTESDPVATTPGAPAGNGRLVEMARPAEAVIAPAYGPFRLIDPTRVAMAGITDRDSVASFEALLRDNPGVTTIEMIDCPGTEDDRANLRLGRLIRDKGIATHVPANGFVGSGAVEIYLAGVTRTAEPGAEFAVHSWEDDTGREPADYAPDAPQNLAYIDFYRAMGMSEGEAQSFYAMTNSVPYEKAKWLTAGEMDRWARYDAREAPAPALEPAAPQLGVAGPAPRAVSYGPFHVLDGLRAAMVGTTDERSPAAFEAMMRDYPAIATLEMIDCPGTEDDRANLRLGRMIHDRGIATHVPSDGWVASGAVDLFLAGIRRTAEATARFAVHSWEDDTGRGPQDYAADAPKNRAYIDYYRTVGMSEDEARAFYAMTNAAPFSHPRSLTTADLAQWARLDRDDAPRATFAQALPLRSRTALASF